MFVCADLKLDPILIDKGSANELPFGLRCDASHQSVKTTPAKRKPSAPRTIGRVNLAKVDATTETQIRQNQRIDTLQAKADGGAYLRGIRERLGFTQSDFAQRINVPLDTLRNWEQGKRKPTGAASALLKILDKAPQAALAALA